MKLIKIRSGSEHTQYSYTLTKLPFVGGFVFLATYNKCPFILAIFAIY